jgi:DNA-binding transcriptional LysR family regulator
MNKLNFRTLDLNLLRVFDAVMAERNLTKAAQRLAMTQPAVSNAMRRLREALGDELVKRAGYGVEPTAKALQLWPAIRESLLQIRNTLSPNLFDPALAEDNFVLAMADATATELMPGLIHSLNTQAPHVGIRVLPLTTRDPKELLRSRHIDLAIGHFPGVMAELSASHLQDNKAQFMSERLYDGQYVVVMRKSHPLAQKEHLLLDDFCQARHLLVSFSGRPYGFVDEALAAVGRSRQVVMTVNQFFTAGRAVASADLLTVLPQNFVQATGVGDAVTTRDLPLQVPEVHVHALWHHELDADPAQRWLRAQIQQASTRRNHYELQAD